MTTVNKVINFVTRTAGPITVAAERTIGSQAYVNAFAWLAKQEDWRKRVCESHEQMKVVRHAHLWKRFWSRLTTRERSVACVV